ncbi:tetratricopeptide repeat protein [Chitinophaga horti]|uniref:Tetratricopeptide repeat protein n=1 Tax=Chitinophaga horti TaxID=2920382 RepID=A0ABY6J4X7_9BACT|nr:tetratricopeptide repeat protein [Chitinophaga horti]UYQ94730.1 tetratricopeptide repeat protein [Chitinophaga horti]
MKYPIYASLLLAGALAAGCNNHQPKEQAAAGPDTLLYTPLVKPLTDSIAQFPKQHELYYRRGLALFNDAPELALKDFQSAAQLNPTYTDYWATSGEAALVMEQYKDAAIAFEQALKTAPQHPYIQYKLAIALIENGQPAAADSLAGVLAKSEEGQDKAYYLKARIAEDKGDTTTAITHLKAAVKVAGIESDYDAVMELASLLKDQEALQYYALASKIDPTLADPHYAAGQYFELKGQPQEAIKAYQEAILADPGYEEAYLAITDIFARSGKWKEAKHFANLTVRNKPNSARGYYNRGYAAEQLGDMAAAKADYQKALGFRKNFPEATEALARVSGKK